MSKTQLLGALFVGVILVGGAFAMLKSNGEEKMASEVATSTSQKEVLESSEEQTQVAEKSGKKIPFSEFIKKGGSYKCTVNQSVGGTDSVGITYLDGGMIRGEYNTKTQGLNINSIIVVRDGYTYTWTSMMPNKGFRAKVVDSGTQDNKTESSATYSFQAEQIGEYECTPWTSDSSMFALPENISFSDIN